MANLYGAHPAKGKKRRTRAETLVGEAVFAKQKQRAARSRLDAITSGKSVDKASTREVMLRMKEYKKPKHGRKKK